MRKLIAVTCVACFAAATGHGQTDFLRERSEGYLAIFNNLNLQGWKTSEEGRWKAEDNALVGAPEARLIETSYDAFADYTLRFEWKVTPQGRGAVLLRGSGFDRAAVNLGDLPEGSGGLEASGLRPARRTDNPVGEWNRMEITVTGQAIAVRQNEQVVLSRAVLSGMPERGSVGFRNSGGELALRSVRLRPLGLDVPYFVARVQPTFKLQCVGCHTGSSRAAQKFPLQIPDLGNYDDSQIMSDYLEAARRVRPGQPEDSLLLNKATGRVPHGGGRQIAMDGPEYKAFAGWIRGEMLKK